MFLSPSTEWNVVSNETQDWKAVTRNFVLPVSILLGITKFIGSFLFLGNFDFLTSLIYAVSHALSVFLGFYLSSLSVNQIAPSFAIEINKDKAFKYIAYSMVPFFISTFLSNLFPNSLFFLNLLYFYSLFLLWQGAGKILKTPDSMKLGFTLIVTIILALIILAVDKTITSLFI